MPMQLSDNMRFKCAEEVVLSGKSISEVASKYGIGKRSILKWATLYKSGALAKDKISYIQELKLARQRIKTLEKKVKELELLVEC